jgi:hypothetical protein
MIWITASAAGITRPMRRLPTFAHGPPETASTRDRSH